MKLTERPPLITQADLAQRSNKGFRRFTRRLKTAVQETLQPDGAAIQADYVRVVLDQRAEAAFMSDTNNCLAKAGKQRMSADEFWHFVGTLLLISSFKSWATAYAWFPTMQELNNAKPMAEGRAKEIYHHLRATSVRAEALLHVPSGHSPTPTRCYHAQAPTAQAPTTSDVIDGYYVDDVSDDDAIEPVKNVPLQFLQFETGVYSQTRRLLGGIKGLELVIDDDHARMRVRAPAAS